MKSTLRRVSVLAFVILVAGLVSAYPQMCGQWRIKVAIVDENDKLVVGAKVEFEQVEEGDAANQVKFRATDGEEHTFEATFSEGSQSAKKYNIVVSGPGFYQKIVEINNSYCCSSAHKVVLVSNDEPRAIFSDVRVLSGYAMTNKNWAAGSIRISSRKGDYYYALTDEKGLYSIKLKPGIYTIDENFASCDPFSSPEIVIGEQDVKYDFTVICQL